MAEPSWTNDPIAALAEAERRIEQDGAGWWYGQRPYVTALERLPRNLDRLAGTRVDISDTRISDLTGLSSKPDVTSLVLNDQITDISAVEALHDLEELVAYKAPLEDLSPLRNCRSLKSLQINVSHVSDLSPLTDLPSLDLLQLWSYRGQPLWRDGRVKHFNIIHASARSADLSPLTTWPLLGLLSCDGAAIVGRLPALPSLHFLSIPGCDDEAFSALSGYASLKTLFAYNGSVSDLRPLAPCAQLETVNATDTDISNVEPLLDKALLRDLAISGTRVSEITALSWLPNLRYLWADRTPVTNLTGWNPKSAIWTLSIADTKVTNLSELSGAALRLLTIARTPVSDLRFIAGLPALSGLNFSGTLVSDFAPVVAKPKLLTDTTGMDPRDACSFFLDFSDTPLARDDAALGAISQIKDDDLRKKALREHLGLDC
jgi:Leucine-rich repeat (LRR) protein